MRNMLTRAAGFTIIIALVSVASLALSPPSGASGTDRHLYVTADPSSQLLSYGATAYFHADATGYTSVRWQSASPTGPWQNAGSTSLTLSVVVVPPLSGYRYRALFRNRTSSATTPAATLSIYDTTGNWAGYETVTTPITAASATWVVPSVSCGPSTNASAWEWVGVSSPGYTNIEQLGTATICVNGSPSYFPWYEAWGDASLNNGYDVTLGPNYPLVPGDVVTASVSEDDDVWTYNISDGTAWSYSNTATIDTAATTAEWVVEDPTNCTSPLASSCALDDFASTSPINFTNVSFLSNNQPTAPRGTNSTPLEMMVGGVVVAEPGLLTANGSTFSIAGPATLPPTTAAA